MSEVREFLATPAGTIGVVITNATGTTTSFYLQDHLGSNVASVNATTGVVTRSSYDVWGVRTGAILDKGNRGYTGHEHLDFGLIHMNGRVYDPRWGRFLQADPIIQSPYDLQNYNRYSYVMNNPLSFTDPTGFSAWSRRWRPAIVATIGNIICGGYPCGTIGVAYHTGGGRAAGWAVASYVAPVIAGFAEAGANGGGLKNGLFLAFANVAGMGGTGSIYGDIALNAAGGCARGRVSGAGCANGAGNAVASQFVSAGVQAAGSAAVDYLQNGSNNFQSNDLSRQDDLSLIQGSPNSSKFLIGTKQFIIEGGDQQERTQAQESLQTIFATPRGAEMLVTLESRRFMWFFKTSFIIDFNVVNNAYARTPGDSIVLDPKFHPMIQTTNGPLPATTLRIMAHELGHAVFGTRDAPLPLRMDNVRLNENPIMNSLGQPSRNRY